MSLVAAEDYNASGLDTGTSRKVWFYSGSAIPISLTTLKGSDPVLMVFAHKPV